MTLRGNVECDRTSLGKFSVGQGCTRFQKEISEIQQEEIRAGRAKPKSFCVHIECLGAFQQDGPALLHLSSPRVPRLALHSETHIPHMIFRSAMLPFWLLMMFSKMRSLYW